MKNDLDKLNQLTESHGALRPGNGLITGVIALLQEVAEVAREQDGLLQEDRPLRDLEGPTGPA